MNTPTADQYHSVNRAFSKQAINYDADDKKNPVLQDLRQQVYKHVRKFLHPSDKILELNAGTAIDAAHFATLGHHVLATDVSDGMVAEIEKKRKQYAISHLLGCQQLSYENLDQLNAGQFNYVFSNFGGLNCLDDISKVTRNLANILNPGAHITFVIMPRICLWEWLWIFTGNGKHAFRRLKKGGVMAHLEGHYFKTYYYSLSQVVSFFGKDFRLLKSEGLAALSPPPSRGDFPIKHPTIYAGLRKLDAFVRTRFPFNRWADHIIVTFKFIPNS